MKRVTFDIVISVTAEIEEGISLDNIVNELDYDISFSGDEASILDTEITNWNQT